MAKQLGDDNFSICTANYILYAYLLDPEKVVFF